MSTLHDQHVLILGLGTSGLAMARWCARCGAQVTVADTRSTPPQLVRMQSELPAARFVSGAFDASLIEGSEIRAVFKSPGLTPLEVAAVADAAHAVGIPVAGELSLFAQALADLRATRDYAPTLLAVTGTNGKTTVTALTGQLVARAGKSVVVAGNIGPSLLDSLSAALDADALPQVWVLELSSFQLDGESSFEPSAAAVLNITQDHLDWHGSMAAYVEAKARVFGKQGLMLLNRDDPLVLALLNPPLPEAPTLKSARAKLQRPVIRAHVTFGADLPTRPGDFGLEEVNGMVWLVRALEADETIKKRNSTQQSEVFIQRLMPADALRIRGRHNALNALAALALACAADCALGPMLYGLREYRGEPHRVESIGSVNGVEYFDDSKGTNVGATVAAVNGLGSERKLIVILGGEGKGQDFSPLAQPLARHARAVILIGRDATLIRAALQDRGVVLLDAASMELAVSAASELAQPGDAVLMSPACASFDMFDNYEHRARVFAQALGSLADAAGVALEGAL